MKQPVLLGDRNVVDAGLAAAHEAELVELPLLVAVAAIPVAEVVVPFIGKAHGDVVVREGPYFLDQAIVELTRPFAAQKRLDRLAALKKFGAVAPAAVGRVGAGDATGSRVFQASSAVRAFCAAVSRENGGNGGRVVIEILPGFWPANGWR